MTGLCLMQGMQVVEYNVYTFRCHYSVPSLKCISKFRASKSIGLLNHFQKIRSVGFTKFDGWKAETIRFFVFSCLTRSIPIRIAHVEFDFACKEKLGVLSSGRLCVVCGACDPIPCLQGPGKSWNDSVEWAVKVTRWCCLLNSWDWDFNLVQQISFWWDSAGFFSLLVGARWGFHSSLEIKRKRKVRVFSLKNITISW